MFWANKIIWIGVNKLVACAERDWLRWGENYGCGAGQWCMLYEGLAGEGWWPGLGSRRRGLYLGTHTAGDRKQVLNASCCTWPGAFITSYCSEDLKEQARAWQEVFWLINPLTFICNSAFRAHGQGLHQKPQAKQGMCIMQCLCNGL